MNKLLCSIAALSISLYAAAEGYQVNTLSARQGGMGHTGVAQKLGAESMYFNPAGLGFMNKTLDLSASVNAVSATAKAKINGKWHETDNGISTPMIISAAFNIYDNLKAGINIYTPYGSSIDWTVNWPGAVLNQSVDLATYTVQPTVAWRITPKLSVGAGLMVAWGNVDLNKGLVVPGTLDKILQATGSDQRFNSTMPASVNLTGDADVAYGFNVGVMYEFDKRWTAGVNFRSKMTMRVKAGEARVSYANELARGILESKLGLINEANFKAEMPMPSVLTFGVSYKPVDALLLAFDAQFTGWSTYKNLDINFLDETVKAYDQHLVKDYKNAWAFRLGAQYSLTPRLDLRAGFIVDMTPVNKNYYNPETPGMTKLEPSLGLSFRPLPSLSIDLAMLYVAGLGEKGAKCTYLDLLAGQLGQNPERTFEADYKVHAFVPSIGVSFSF